MRVAFLMAAATMMVVAAPTPQSYPSWWNFASPDATALVGVRWETVRNSPLAEALLEEIGPDGEFDLPDLSWLRRSKQLLLSSPPTLVVASGDFPAAELRAEAAAHGLKAASYKGVDLWISPARSTLSVAMISDRVLLLGLRRNLESAIDRSQAAVADRRYSTLLKRASRFANQDLWVVASQLPDPLASRFVPLDVDANNFEASVSLADGLRVEGTLAADSADDAADIAAGLRRAAASLPPMARGLQFVPAGDMVVLTLAIGREQLAAVSRPGVPVAAAAQPPPVPQQAAIVAAAPAPVAAPPVQAAAAPAPLAKTITPIPAGPRVIRILGLDEGTREIRLPSAEQVH